MRIALLDLNHTTCGIHTAQAPLALGMIAAYVRKEVGGDLDIRIFKETDPVLAALRSWTPDIVGIAQYSWNSELNLHVAQVIRDLNPACLIVAGGPNLELFREGKLRYLQAHRQVDLCVAYDGEIPFAALVRRRLAGETTAACRANPPAGCYALDPEHGGFVESPEPPPRLNSLDAIGPVYTDGRLDEFLAAGYHPFLQTHRGCPFACAFCHNGDSHYTKMLFLSTEIFRMDLEYVAKKFAGRHDIILHLANTNMSLFPEDFAIAHAIRDIREKYDWPEHVAVSSGKNPQKLLEMVEIINFHPSLALQTLTPQVLQNIKRRNLPFSEYCDFQDKVFKWTQDTSITELILSLPGETKATFLQTLRAVMNSGVQNIVIYTLMNLKGTPLGSEEYARKYGHEIMHRVVPRQFSVIAGKKILDTEEVVVGTTAMPFADYLDLRSVAFTVGCFFSSTEFVPLKRFLLEWQVDVAEWMFLIHGGIGEFVELKKFHDDFMRETREELFPTRSALVEFYADTGHYADLVRGVRGDNLFRKYKCLVLSEGYGPCLQLAVAKARQLARAKPGGSAADAIIDDLEKFMASRDIKDMLLGRGTFTAQRVSLNYDVPQWFSHNADQLPLEKFRGTHAYLVDVPPETRAKCDDYMGMNMDKTLSLQILHMNSRIRELWPVWSRAAAE